MNPGKLAIDIRIAMAVSTDEALAARAVGMTAKEAHESSYAALDDVLLIAAAPLRPTIPPMWRSMTTPRRISR